jgi:hypothetical protein
MIRQFRQIKLPEIGTIIRNKNGGGEPKGGTFAHLHTIPKFLFIGNTFNIFKHVESYTVTVFYLTSTICHFPMCMWAAS